MKNIGKNKILPEEVIINNNNILDLDSIKNITIISNDNNNSNNNQSKYIYVVLFMFLIIIVVIFISFLSNSKIFSRFT